MRGDDAYSPATVCLRQRHHAALYTSWRLLRFRGRVLHYGFNRAQLKGGFGAGKVFQQLQVFGVCQAIPPTPISAPTFSG